MEKQLPTKENRQVQSYDLFKETLAWKDKQIERLFKLIDNQSVSISANLQLVATQKNFIIELQQAINEHNKIKENKVWAVQLHIAPRSVKLIL